MVTNKALIITITAVTITILIIVIAGCTEGVIKTSFLETSPKEVSNIIKNNSKIPSFISDLSLSIDKQSFDGSLFVDRKEDSVELTLKDTLTENKVMDAYIIKDKVKISTYINGEKDKVIQDTKKSINLKEYFKDLNVSLEHLLLLISLKTHIIENPDQIVKQENPNLKTHTFYQLKNSNENTKQIISISNKTNYTKSLVFFKNDKRIFSLQYKKYKKYKNFFFPQRIDLYHNLTDVSLIIFFSNTIFNT